MKTVLELDVNEHERTIIEEMLRMMNVPFQSRTVEEESPFEPGAPDAAIEEAIVRLRGAWEGRFEDFNDFRRQAWKGRGVK
ncbi:hypothetical protein BN8_01774 [Fibrisoma limi BUZ 3]|uniref:Uncharacterized protein n=1 Tax=Fibrisoma limi BUZ 3 TaxID=1185876 RepID=I2GFS7_9BACT|nr:hypothetical protein [Fibrisoma limi]CCH52752.1 hypothetical protein BN8_01774 [Fibrisoma limi BUZ 3]